MVLEKKAEEFEIDLLELAQVLLHRLWVIIIVMVLCGGITLGYTVALIKPQYTASVLLYVNNSNISVGSASFSISNADLSAAQKLVDTYVVILKSRRVLNQVIEESGTMYSYDQLLQRINAASVNNTEVFRITVTTGSAQESEKIANIIARVLPDKISDIVLGSDVKVVDYAVIPSQKSSPSLTKNTAIGALAGLVLVCAVIIIRYLLDDSIQSEDYLTDTYPDVPLLAVIPDLADSKSSGYDYYGGYAKASRQQSNKSEDKPEKSEDNE